MMVYLIIKKVENEFLAFKELKNALGIPDSFLKPSI